MSAAVTLAISAALLALALFAGWRGARPPDPMRGPWRFIMLLSATGLLPMIVHLVNLAGFTTGR